MKISALPKKADLLLKKVFNPSFPNENGDLFFVGDTTIVQVTSPDAEDPDIFVKAKISEIMLSEGYIIYIAVKDKQGTELLPSRSQIFSAGSTQDFSTTIPTDYVTKGNHFAMTGRLPT